jgi:hypothetical protein
MEASAYLDGYTILPTEQYEKMKFEIINLEAEIRDICRNMR